MRFLVALPLLSAAYAQGTATGQVPLADGDPLLTDSIGEQEYKKVCPLPTDIETEIAPGTFVQYYCDRQPQHWNDKVAGVLSIEDCALACTRIETCKGTFWKSHDGTCWWSDQEFLVELDGADLPCTVVPGSVYMTVREGYPDGCALDLIECHKKTQVLEDVVEFWKEKDLESAKQIMALTRENDDLRKQRDDLEEKLTQNCVSYVINGRNWAACEQKQPSIAYGSKYEIARKHVGSARDCMQFCSTYTTCKWAHFARAGGSSRLCVLYSNAVSTNQMTFRQDWDLLTYA